MPSTIFERFKVIDVDTHLTEPPDIWVDRVSKKWGDKVPHIVTDPETGKDKWMSGDNMLGGPSITMAGFPGFVPDGPKGYHDIPKGAFDSHERLKLMDKMGIYAQVLYPNVGGFGAQSWLGLGDMELVQECLRAYNDFLIEWCAPDPDRLIPVASTPFWDLDLALAEVDHALETGHRGINFCNRPEDIGLPALVSTHWDPIWARAQEAGVPICFHIGGGDVTPVITDRYGIGWKTNFAQQSCFVLQGNLKVISDLIFGGICHRFPDLKFVSVESGVGWIPGILETFDWQWLNSGVRVDHPEYDLLPTDYFKRQIYGCFWFERQSALFAIEQLPDNILYETDFPHPTCMYENSLTPAQDPRVYAEETLGKLPEDVLAKVMHDTAAKLYGIKG